MVSYIHIDYVTRRTLALISMFVSGWISGHKLFIVYTVIFYRIEGKKLDFLSRKKHKQIGKVLVVNFFI